MKSNREEYDIEGEEVKVKPSSCNTNGGAAKKGYSFGVIKIVVTLLILIGCAVVGLSFSGDFSTRNITKPNIIIYKKATLQDCSELTRFAPPKQLMHSMTDEELFLKVSKLPNVTKEKDLCKRVPKIAFLYLTRGPLPLMPLWEKFFRGHEKLFTVYVHALPGYKRNVSHTSPFFERQIPSQNVEWGMVSILQSERRLLANALLDYSNERFVLLSESCVPLFNFTKIYDYIINYPRSFVDSFDEYKVFTWGRYKVEMEPVIFRHQWRKGSAWFELSRSLALPIVLDTLYFPLFEKHLRDAFAEEHYVSTFLNLKFPGLNSNRTLTFTDWTRGGGHPATYGDKDVNLKLIEFTRNRGSSCLYHGRNVSDCFLFARKFAPSSLQQLLNISSSVLGF